jgi:hypothetical protein
MANIGVFKIELLHPEELAPTHMCSDERIISLIIDFTVPEVVQVKAMK